MTGVEKAFEENRTLGAANRVSTRDEARPQPADLAEAGSEANPISPVADARTQLEPLSHALAGKLAAPQAAAGCSAPELGALRGRIFRAIRDGDYMLLATLLPVYGAKLETLVTSPHADPDALHRAAADHTTFFEQLKAALVTNRIQVRLELERVKASRQYANEAPEEVASGWHG